MCFITPNNVRKAKTATKDIIAFKAMNLVIENNKQEMRSPTKRTFKWTVGKLFNADLENPLPFTGANINVGFHSFKRKSGAKNYGGNTVVPVMIPKGAIYYENKTQFVSNQMTALGTNIEIFEKIAKALKPIKKSKN